MRCAQCRCELTREQHMKIVLEAALVSGMESGYIVVHFCSPWCTWLGGVALGAARSTNHTVAYESDSFEVFTGPVPS